MKFPFEVSFEELQRNLHKFVDVIISSIQSNFLELPKGRGFVQYSDFQKAYEVLKKATNNFDNLIPKHIELACIETPLVFVVLRTILGFTPAEWAHKATEHTHIEVPERYIRRIDRRARLQPFKKITFRDENSIERFRVLLQTACDLLERGAPEVREGMIHRLDKVDTKYGKKSLKQVSSLGIPYPMLLYERLLGRPFASHRDSVSELIGEILEGPIEDLLIKAGISYRKTKRAEKVPGFDQAPDFVIPDEFRPCVVIEAKLAEDEGTARDKITRIQRLALQSERWKKEGKGFEVIACIDGRGFARKSDIEKLLKYTKGKVFTLKTLNKMIEYTKLKEFQTHKD